MEEPSAKKRRVTREDGVQERSSKAMGVNKVVILAVTPMCNESIANISLLLDLVNLKEISFKVRFDTPVVHLVTFVGLW